MKGFRSNQKGNVAITVAIFLSVLIMLAAGAIDIGRAVYARSLLQMEMDAAMKAAAAISTTQTPGGQPDTQKMINVAKNYFEANHNADSSLFDGMPVFAPTYRDDSAYDDSMVATLDANIRTAFMKIVGKTTIPVHLEAVARRPRAPPLEMALALDVTQSMADALPGGRAKIVELRAAAVGLSDYVLKSPYAKVGLVPFTQMVNVGTGYNGETWLTVGAGTSINDANCRWTEQPTCTVTTGQCKKTDSDQYESCEVPSCTGGTRVCDTRTTAFLGCIPPRMIPPNPPLVPTTVPSADISSPTNPTYQGPAGGCINPLLRDLTAAADYSNSGASTVSGWINALGTVNNGNVGNTFVPIGLIWAWNMLDPAAPLTTASSATGADLPNRSIVLVTDGDNTYYPGAGSGTPVAKTSADALTTRICENIKTTTKIRLFVVAITIPTASTLTMLKDCASDASMFYNVQNAAQLSTAFDQIGKSLSYNSLVK